MPERLCEAAIAVLHANDLGSWTKPAPRLYPHQWSWDSAFVAIGLAHVDPERALLELERLFQAQWADGRVPQIVYNPAVPPEGYFPDAARWACAELSPAAPRAPRTSGICQPPVHALAVWRICELAPDLEPLLPRLRALYPKLLAWHRYLAERRDPDETGLLTIYHPWESGTDNSPRWDEPLANVEVGPDLPPYVRRDLQHVADPSMRPTDAEYDRYLWLVECLKRARYDDAAAHREHPFLVKDVLFSAIFAVAAEALGKLAERLDAPDHDRWLIAGWTRRSAEAVAHRARRTDCWGAGWTDHLAPLALDVDLRAERPIAVATWAGLAPLLVPNLPVDLAEALVVELAGPRFAGAAGLVFPVIPSTAPGSPGFRAETYWRGPAWPIANWLLWWGLGRQGRGPAALALREANLALLAQPGARFDEYFQPFTGQPLGSPEQSWSAAVALDWLAAGEAARRPSC